MIIEAIAHAITVLEKDLETLQPSEVEAPQEVVNALPERDDTEHIVEITEEDEVLVEVVDPLPGISDLEERISAFNRRIQAVELFIAEGGAMEINTTDKHIGELTEELNALEGEFNQIQDAINDARHNGVETPELGTLAESANELDGMITLGYQEIDRLNQLARGLRAQPGPQLRPEHDIRNQQQPSQNNRGLGWGSLKFW